MILASMAAVLPCSGQDAEPVPATDAHTDDQNTDDPPSVYVGDSFEAQTAFRQADRLAEDKRWRQAVRAYDRAAEQFADKLVRIGPGAFLGAVSYASRRIAAWPDDGLKVYRLLHAESADRALAEARSAPDLDGLLAVMDAHFCTRQAATAGDLAAQLAIEAGEFDLARRVYERLLAEHPDRQRLAVELESKLALCLAWTGQTDAARAKLDRIKADNPNATLSWAGQRRNAVGVIEQAIADRVPPAVADRAFVWPMLGGGPQRSRVVPTGVPPGAPLWEYGPKQGYDPTTAGIAKLARRTSRSPVRQAYSSRNLGVSPVVADQILYWCDRTTVWAVRATGGSPTWPPYRAGEATAGRTRSGPSGQVTPPDLFTCTLHAGRLYVILDQPPGPTRSQRTREPEPDLSAEVTSGLLACLDAATGRPIWSARLARLDPGLAGVSLDGAPVWHRGKLFAVGRRRKRFGFEDCYLLRFDAATGRLDWQRHLASSSVSTYGRRRATFAYPTICEATVFVCTNLGVIAAVNARDGLIRWLRVYHRDRTEEESGGRLARHMSPWQYAPPICWRDALVCRPLDSEYVVVVNRADGQIVRRIESGRLGHARQILGVIDDTLYTAGRELVAWNLAEHEPHWSRSLATYGGIMGRGQLTRSHVYLPTKNGLCRFALPDGTPASFDWPDDAVGGNVVVTPELVIVAGDDRLTGYAPKDQAFARLQQRIDAAPSDPEPLVDLAEVAFRVGERRRAVAALERAVEVGGGFAQVTDPKVRARLFQNFIQFGDRAVDDPPADYPLALEMYQQAAQCPPDTDAQVVYRLRLAEALTGTDRFGQAIEQYQQILADRGLRVRPIRPRLDKQSWPAGQWAERRIDAILSDHGRAPYERFERRAETMLALAVERSDLAAMQRLVESFPNARAARRALLARGQILEQRGEPRQAVRAYLQVLNRQPKHPDAPAILRRIAEAYLSADRPVAARRRRGRGARPEPSSSSSCWRRTRDQAGCAGRGTGSFSSDRCSPG